MVARIRVGVNGYGVIGKRVADAVRAQGDMDLIGVSDVTTDYRIRAATVLTFPNVVITGHQSFFTVEALQGIVETTLGSITAFERGEPLAHRVTAARLRVKS